MTPSDASQIPSEAYQTPLDSKLEIYHRPFTHHRGFLHFHRGFTDFLTSLSNPIEATQIHSEASMTDSDHQRGLSDLLSGFSEPIHSSILPVWNPNSIFLKVTKTSMSSFLLGYQGLLDNFYQRVAICRLSNIITQHQNLCNSQKLLSLGKFARSATAEA